MAHPVNFRKNPVTFRTSTVTLEINNLIFAINLVIFLASFRVNQVIGSTTPALTHILYQHCPYFVIKHLINWSSL